MKRLFSGIGTVLVKFVQSTLPLARRGLPWSETDVSVMEGWGLPSPRREALPLIRGPRPSVALEIRLFLLRGLVSTAVFLGVRVIQLPVLQHGPRSSLYLQV